MSRSRSAAVVAAMLAVATALLLRGDGGERRASGDRFSIVGPGRVVDAAPRSAVGADSGLNGSGIPSKGGSRSAGARAAVAEGAWYRVSGSWRGPEDDDPPRRVILVRFCFASDVVPSAARRRLMRVRGARPAPVAVRIVGHADAVGDRPDNDDLSRRRAEAVQRVLGPIAAETDVDWHGETRPLAPNRHRSGRDNPSGRALNRRVRIVITYRRGARSTGG